VSDHDAFEDEMLFRTLSDRDVDRILRGHAPAADAFDEVAEFSRSVQATLPARPENPDLIRRLAATARSASLEDEAVTKPLPAPRRARTGRPMPHRLAAVGKLAAVIVSIPLLFAGLALADVTLPTPARKAFEAVGVSLPNQPPADQVDEDAVDGTDAGRPGLRDGNGRPAASPAKSSEQGPSPSAAPKRGHGTAKANPARAGGRANGEQAQGRALGKRGLAPGQIEPPGQTHAPGQLKKSSEGNQVTPVPKPEAKPPAASKPPPRTAGTKPAKAPKGNTR
jgi:hypothetical protein